MHRNKVYQLLLICFTAILGISSRKTSVLLPDWVSAYAGDILWALEVFWLLGFIFKSASTWRLALTALVFSYFIEATQLYHSPGIDSIRDTFIGALVLGNTFIWSDMLCYTLGVFTGALLEKLFRN